MLQFYFLSVMTNAAAGMILAADYLSAHWRPFAPVGLRISSRGFRLGFGVAALLVGVCKLAWPVAPGTPVVGDLMPAVTGMAMGVALLFEVFRQDAIYPREPAERSAAQGLDWRALLGFIGMGIAVLHFFLPERPLL